MPKKLPALFAAVLLLLLLAAPSALAADISVQVNGQPLALDVPPVVENGRTLVPVRAITERLGAYVEWFAEARRVEIELEERKLTLIIDSTIAYVDGVPKQLDAPARIVGGSTLVPTRFISESLNAEVEWHENIRQVSIVTYEDVAPQSAALAQMEAEVLAAINERRAKLSYSPLINVGELSQMARSHAADLAKNGAFTHNSGRFGETQARASARGLKISYEYLAHGLPDAAAIADALLSAEQGGRLLAKENRFFGLGLYQGAKGGNADIYAVAELSEGEGFMLGWRQRRLSGPQTVLTGYAAAGAPLTVYLLNGQGQYLSRQTYTLNTDSAGRFSLDFSLPQAGRFAANLGEDTVIFIYE